MSITRLVKQRLHDMLVSCDAIVSYTADISYVDYLQDEMRRDAVERRLGIIGEALHRAEELEPDIAEHFPEIRQIVGMRNRIIHGYDAVDDEVVWRSLKRRVPALRATVAALLGEA